MKQLKVKEEELIEKEQKLAELIQELDVLKGLYEELDARYDDETYTTSQIMYTADEIAIAIADSVLFEENRDDIYMNLLPHLEHNRFRSCATPCPPHCQKQVVHIPSRVENNHSNEHNETGHPAFRMRDMDHHSGILFPEIFHGIYKIVQRGISPQRTIAQTLPYHSLYPAQSGHG
jgi:hypothetical protein